MKVAIIYDRVNKWGGAERVLLALHELFPKAPLYTSVYSRQKADWACVFEKNGGIRTSFLQKISLARGSHEFFSSLMPVAFESFDFSSYDLVISVTSEFSKAVITGPSTAHISIVLTPTRYLWSGYEHYFRNPLLKTASYPIVRFLRHADTVFSYRPDEIVAISTEVQKRIKKYYKRDSIIIFPPVTITSQGKTKQKLKKNMDPYFLVVSRLVSYKRIDLAVEAANRLKIPLKIIGEGRDAKRLEKIAGPTVEFLGFVSEEELAEYYQDAQALIFAGVEDFGIVMVEAQMHGIPVIAFNAGGAKDIVIKGVTGELFPEQSAESLIDVLKSFDRKRYNSKSLVANARRFSKDKFKKSVEALVSRHKKNI